MQDTGSSQDDPHTTTFVFLTQINFFIFVRIIHLLVAKLRAHQMHYADSKFRWARARAWVRAGGGWGWGRPGRGVFSSSAPAGWPGPH